MDTSNIQIKKAKIYKKSYLEVTYTDAEGNEVTVKGNYKVHTDLKATLNRLVPYFAELTEQKEASAIDWENLQSIQIEQLLSKIKVTGVTESGQGSTQVVAVLVGRRMLATSKLLNVVSPTVGYDSDTEPYQRCEDVATYVDAFFSECAEYLKGKADATEATIDFDAEPPVDDPFAEDKGAV